MEVDQEVEPEEMDQQIVLQVHQYLILVEEVELILEQEELAGQVVEELVQINLVE
tara:strand:+ start:326 stop:490 length:165 start_codon:yes stop_codon:yes gene_type:complete